MPLRASYIISLYCIVEINIKDVIMQETQVLKQKQSLDYYIIIWDMYTIALRHLNISTY